MNTTPIPTPTPAGFSEPIHGKLIHPAKKASLDIIKWSTYFHEWSQAGWNGGANFIYALRIGSAVYEANSAMFAPKVVAPKVDILDELKMRVLKEAQKASRQDDTVTSAGMLRVLNIIDELEVSA